MPHSLVIIVAVLVELAVALALWVAWRAARRQIDSLTPLATQSGELREVLERSHSELVDLRSRAHHLAALTGPDDVPVPEEPLACLNRVEKHIRSQYAALGRHHRVEQQLREDLLAAREGLSEAQRRLREARMRREDEARSQGLTNLPSSADLLESLAQQTAVRLQLKTAQTELEDLRGKLRLANRAILDMEDRMEEQQRLVLEAQRHAASNTQGPEPAVVAAKLAP